MAILISFLELMLYIAIICLIAPFQELCA